jgi:hypothetical protein
MASVFVKNGRLILQLRIRGVQLREALHLRDTAATGNGKANVCWSHESSSEGLLIIGNFPNSRSAKAKAMFPRDRPEDLTVEAKVLRWFEQVKPRWGSAMAYDVETMIDSAHHTKTRCAVDTGF